MTSPATATADVDPTDAAHLLGNGAVLIDVREPDEWAAGHAPDARHLPLGDLRATALPADRTLITVCRSGKRSSVAAEKLRAAGLSVRNLTGGMQAWAAAGLPVRDDQDRPGSVA